MGLNKRLVNTGGGAGADFSKKDSFGDGTGLAYWVNPENNNGVSVDGGYQIKEDLGALSSYSFSPGGGIALHYNNDRVSVRQSSSTSAYAGMDTNQSYTVSSWIRLGAGQQAFLFYNYWSDNNGLNNDFAYVRDVGNGTWDMRIRHKFMTHDGDTFNFNPSNYTAYNSYYRHFGMVFDKDAGQSRYYINGSKVLTANLSPKPASPTVASIMGSSFYNGSWSSYTCYMGDIRWYQKALTDDEYLAMAQYDGIP